MSRKTLAGCTGNSVGTLFRSDLLLLFRRSAYDAVGAMVEPAANDSATISPSSGTVSS